MVSLMRFQNVWEMIVYYAGCVEGKYCSVYLQEQKTGKALTKQFNKSIRTKKMPNEWRESIVVPIYKNKGDNLSCASYCRIKFMSHIMKLLERVIKYQQRHERRVSANQFKIMPGRLTTEAIFLCV